MQTVLDFELAKEYKSPSQIIRVITESWVGSEIYCPSCGSSINKFKNGQPVADFFCPSCNEEYELKSKKSNIGNKIVDGSYKKMIERLKDSNNPNFFFLNYNFIFSKVTNFFVVPKHFFVPQIIEKRKALPPGTRRAGWVGCNIILQQVPKKGRIFYLKDGKVQPKNKVLEDWKKTLFLREEKQLTVKGWILDVMKCIDKLNKEEFALEEVYRFEEELQAKHPDNQHIQAKIRQQLQLLRGKSYLEFIGGGHYRLL